MKTALLVLVLGCALPISAQYSARTLTRKVAPQPAARQPAQPAGQGGQVVKPAAAPVDPAKVAAQKAKTEKNLLEYHKKRAAAGSGSAQYELGIRYLTGKGVEKNEKLGMEWLEKAAKGGNAAAVKKLGEMKKGS